MEPNELTECDEILKRELLEVFSKAPGLDDTPIIRIHHFVLHNDGTGAISVYVDLPNGVTRIFAFCEGEPVHITDHPGMHLDGLDDDGDDDC